MTRQPRLVRALAPLLALAGAALPACGDDGGASTADGGSGGASTTTGEGVTTGGQGGDDTGDGGATGNGGNPSASTAGAGGEGGAGGEAPATAEVHLVGRTVELEPGIAASSWSNTTIRTRIDGGDLGVTIDAPAGLWFQVAIDGTKTSTFVTTDGASTYPVAAALSPGAHDVEIARRNEGFFGTARFVGLVPTGGALVPTPARDRRLLVIGDSLTAGYGIEGADPCDFAGATETSYDAYAAVAARALGADVHVIAYSGKGVLQNYGGDTSEPMPELWSRTITNDPASVWDHAAYTPHAVVVNLGTNDFSAPLDEGAFVDAYAAFLGAIRAVHPDAPIVAVTWGHWGVGREAMVGEAVAATGDDAITTTRFVIQGGEGLGCDGHTNLVTNARFGDELAATLAGLLGW